MEEDQILTQTEANNMSMADQGRRPRKKDPMTLHTVEFPVSNINPIPTTVQADISTSINPTNPCGNSSF